VVGESAIARAEVYDASLTVVMVRRLKATATWVTVGLRKLGEERPQGRRAVS
jgi:hypothetical protein